MQSSKTIFKKTHSLTVMPVCNFSCKNRCKRWWWQKGRQEEGWLLPDCVCSVQGKEGIQVNLYCYSRSVSSDICVSA
uniref:Uncharacterized protein n=1 Tax=Anguilla anguilla TaxID=7936 RepID=A0A0E9RFL5_ANGAN